ncbi:MAG TPA: mRNA surveillance protein pelota [Candidatus Nitrosocosmicus sp.]|nr:mRNA surveillance protein pelota [Candidatus Nitrosocosmicus sp.]
MKTNNIRDSENKIAITPEEPDDLFTLRRVIEIGDNIFVDTTRVIKQDKEFARPDKGERIKIRINLRIEKISFDDTVDRLKISGVIINSNNDNIPRGLYHSVVIKINDTIILEKPRWNENFLRMIKNSTTEYKYILISMDSEETSIARLNGTNLKTTPNIYSGKTGKRYNTNQKNDTLIKNYFDNIINSLNTYKEDEVKTIIFGPGETKRKFLNYIKEKDPHVNKDIVLIEGIETSGQDGFFVFLRSDAMKEIMSNSKIAIVSKVLDNLMHQINKGERKFAIGINEIKYADSVNSIDVLVYSDKVFFDIEENEFIKLLNEIESKKNVKAFATDSSTDIGMRVSSLGGIIALLRYQIN